MNQSIYYGLAGIDFIVQYCQDNKYKNIALFSGKRSFDNSLFAKPLTTKLKLTRFCDFNTNPQVTDIERAMAFIKSHNFDAILAVGGGSVLDVAKLANFFAHQTISLSDYFTNKSKNQIRDILPLIAVPTTTGTGSESTQFATFYLNKVKHSLDHASILPKAAIIDPVFTSTMPPDVRAYSIADAFCQAIESYWSVKSTSISQAFSEKAISLILQNTTAYMANPTNELGLLLGQAANLAGKAIHITRTTAPHAVSYLLTAHFNIAHGQAVATTIADFLQFNSHVTVNDCLDSRGIAFVNLQLQRISQLMRCTTTTDAASYIRIFFNKIGVKASLADLNVSKDEFYSQLQSGLDLSRISNNPRRVTLDDVRSMMSGGIS